jgi:hypothetical protein
MHPDYGPLRQSPGLTAAEMPMTFRFRAGRQQWLTPATDQMVKALARRWFRHLAVICSGLCPIASRPSMTSAGRCTEITATGVTS